MLAAISPLGNAANGWRTGAWAHDPIRGQCGIYTTVLPDCDDSAALFCFRLVPPKPCLVRRGDPPSPVLPGGSICRLTLGARPVGPALAIAHGVLQRIELLPLARLELPVALPLRVEG